MVKENRRGHSLASTGKRQGGGWDKLFGGWMVPRIWKGDCAWGKRIHGESRPRTLNGGCKGVVLSAANWGDAGGVIVIRGP